VSKPEFRLGFFPHWLPAPNRRNQRAGSTTAKAVSPAGKKPWVGSSGRITSRITSVITKSTMGSQLSAGIGALNQRDGPPLESALMLLITEGRQTNASINKATVYAQSIVSCSSGAIAGPRPTLIRAVRTALPRKNKNTNKEKTNWRMLIQSVFPRCFKPRSEGSALIFRRFRS